MEFGFDFSAVGPFVVRDVILAEISRDASFDEFFKFHLSPILSSIL